MKKSSCGLLSVSPVFLVLLTMLTLFILVAVGCGTTAVDEEQAPEQAPGQGSSAEDGEQSDGTATGIEVVDFRNERVELDRPAVRIACLLDSGLTILHMMGIVDEVVAVDKWTYDNKGALPYSSQLDPRLASEELPAITGNIEGLLELQPDIVIIWSGHEDIETLENSGLKVYGVQINSFDDIYKAVADLGKIAGREDRAAEINDYTRNEIEAVTELVAQVSDAEKPAGMFVWGPTLLNIAGKDSTGNDILHMAGGHNVAAEIDQEHTVANMEEAINWNPEVIMMWNSEEISPQTYYEDPQWQEIAAIKNEKVYMLPNAFFCDLWTPKFQYSIKSAAKWLYPEIFAEMNLEQELDDMLEFLYGVQLR